jgi:hypothetical protein
VAAVDGTVLVRGENTGLWPEHTHRGANCLREMPGQLSSRVPMRTFLRRRTFGFAANQACAGLLFANCVLR